MERRKTIQSKYYGTRKSLLCQWYMVLRGTRFSGARLGDAPRGVGALGLGGSAGVERLDLPQLLQQRGAANHEPAGVATSRRRPKR